MSPKDLVTVYHADDEVTAEIVKNALNAEGIRSFVQNPHQAGEVGVLGLAVQVQCAAGDAERARTIIAAHEGKGRKD